MLYPTCTIATKALELCSSYISNPEEALKVAQEIVSLISSSSKA